MTLPLSVIHHPPRVSASPRLRVSHSPLSHSPFLPFSLSLLLLLLAPGCSTNVSVDGWQKSLEDFIWLEANGDPNALRNIPTNAPFKHYSVFSQKNPNESTDAVGLLLAHRPLNGRPHFIFLLGLVRHRSVEDIRLAIMTPDADQFRWTVIPPNSESLQAYRQYRESLWRKANPSQTEIPPAAYTFPGEDDLFDLNISATVLTVTHRQSRAQWTLVLPSATAAALKE